MQSRFTFHNPAWIHSPFGSLYSHAVEVTFARRTLYVAGQVGVDKDGVAPSDPIQQLDLAWANTIAVLHEAKMTINNIVKVVCFMANPAFKDAYANSCRKHLGDHKPAMTAPVVRQLWSSEWHFEIEVIAVD